MKQIRKKSSNRVESSSPDGVTAAGDRKHEGEVLESNPTKKRRLTSDSFMVGIGVTHNYIIIITLCTKSVNNDIISDHLIV